MKNNKAYINFAWSVATIFLAVLVMQTRWQLNIFDICISKTQWNDELLYYKQIEAIIKNGLRHGIYGYNESRALVGGLGAWSPILYIPYVVFGKIFGWHYFSPIVFNLICAVIVLFLLFEVLKLDIFTKIIIGLVLSCNLTYIRYAFSVTPEFIIIETLLVFAVAMMQLNKEEYSERWFIIANVVMTFLILSRGYYALLGLYMSYVLYKKSKKSKEIVVVGINTVVTLLGYVFVLHFLTAPYFKTLINYGNLFSFNMLIANIIQCIQVEFVLMYGALFGINAEGVYYIIFWICIALFAILGIKKKKKQYLLVAFLYIVLQFAIWILYDVQIGSRHVIASGIVGIVVVAIEERTKIFNFVIVLAIALLTIGAKSEYSFKPPLDEGHVYCKELTEQQRQIGKIIGKSVDEWDNTMIWTISSVYTDLYALPSYLGINCCYDDYVEKNQVKSLYVATNFDAKWDTIARDMNWELVYKYSETRIWKTR